MFATWGRSFVDAVSCFADPPMRDLVRRILPLCSNYSVVVRFIEGTHVSNFYLRKSCCSVNLAICSFLVVHWWIYPWKWRPIRTKVVFSNVWRIKSYLHTWFSLCRKVGFWIWTGESCSQCSNENAVEGLSGDGCAAGTAAQNGNFKSLFTETNKQTKKKTTHTKELEKRKRTCRTQCWGILWGVRDVCGWAMMVVHFLSECSLFREACLSRTWFSTSKHQWERWRFWHR